MRCRAVKRRYNPVFQIVTISKASVSFVIHKEVVSGSMYELYVMIVTVLPMPPV